MINNAELGQRRWQALSKPKCWLKIIEMVAAVLTIVYCIIFDQTAVVHKKTPSRYFKIFLKFPFIFQENVTVLSPADLLPHQEFKFEPILFPSTIILVVVTSIAFIMAFIFITFYIVQHGTQVEQSHIKWIFFIALGMTFLLLASTGLWLSSFVRLKDNVSNEIGRLMDLCKNDCVEQTPNYAFLYISTVFAIVLCFLWLADCVLIYIKMVHTIPQEIILTTLVRNVELDTIPNDQVS